MDEVYKQRMEKIMERQRKIIKKSIELATPTKKKMEISCITGGIVFIAGCITYPISKPIALGLLAAGSIQVISASLVKKHLETTDK